MPEINLFNIFLILFSFLSLLFWFLSLQNIRHHAFSEKIFFRLFGAFVWADLPVFGLFWPILVFIYLFIVKNPYFLYSGISLFVTVRALGEIIYWLLEQFATTKRNDLRTHFLYKYFAPDSLTIFFQTFWQLVLVFSLLATIYFAHHWLN